jgi:predicted DNA-binding ribbon-helix-helix protein
MKKAEEDRRLTISVRNIKETTWKTLRDIADQRGRKIGPLLSQILDDWARKNRDRAEP